MKDFEGWEFYYIIDSRQRGLSKVVGGVVVDQLNPTKGTSMADALVFLTEEGANNHLAEMKKRWGDHPFYYEVRKTWVPYETRYTNRPEWAKYVTRDVTGRAMFWECKPEPITVGEPQQAHGTWWTPHGRNCVAIPERPWSQDIEELE